MLSSRPRSLLTLALIILFALFAPAGAQAQSDPATGEPGSTLRVATKPLEPFVFLDGAEPSGYSIDVWNHIADELGVTTEWIIFETVGETLDAVENGQADVAIAGISITPDRELRLDFTHAYFDAGLQVYVTPVSGTPLRSAMASLITWSALVPMLALVGLIVIVSHAVWWTERSHNAAFPAPYREGITEALWWSTVNVITGGEAVKEIRRTTGRLLAILWMLIGLLVMAYVTARITSVLTVQELQSPISGVNDLAGRSVITVEGTAPAEFLDDRRISYTAAATLEDALEAMNLGEVEAIVFDAPVLAWRAQSDFSGSITPAGGVFKADKYGIALPSRSPLRESINEVVLLMNVDGTAEELNRIWFGSTP